MAAFASTVIVYVITFVIAYFALKFIGRKRDSHKRPPCLTSFPIIGSLPFISNLASLHIFFQNKAKDLGNIFAFKMCNGYVVVLNGRDIIQEALVKQSLIFADRPLLYLSEYFKEKHRGIIQHPYDDNFKKFHRISLNILRNFGFGQGIMESRITIEVENLLKVLSLKRGEAMYPMYEITASVSNVICSIIFGKRWDMDDPQFQEGIEIAHNLFKDMDKVAMIDFFPFLRFLPQFRKELDKLVILRQRWNNYIQSISKDISNMRAEDCFYEAFIEEVNKEKRISVDQKGIEQQLFITIRDLFLAGTETTATTLLWFIILMANNPDVQKRVRDEIDKVVGVHKHPSLDDKPNLPLLEATILEVMRFKTLVPLAVPHSTLKDTYLDEMFIPANTMVLVNLYSCHMDPETWKNPDIFNIDRFLDESKSKVINREQLVSFSLGKRACLGEILARQELFLFASALIHEFEIYPPIGEDKIEVTDKVTITNSPSAFKTRLVNRQF